MKAYKAYLLAPLLFAEGTASSLLVNLRSRSAYFLSLKRSFRYGKRWSSCSGSDQASVHLYLFRIEEETEEEIFAEFAMISDEEDEPEDKETTADVKPVKSSFRKLFSFLRSSLSHIVSRERSRS
jgi:hypothetical protein